MLFLVLYFKVKLTTKFLLRNYKRREALLALKKFLKLSAKWWIVIVMSMLFSCIEIFLGWT